MTDYALPFLYAVVLWWSTTVALIYTCYRDILRYYR